MTERGGSRGSFADQTLLRVYGIDSMYVIALHFSLHILGLLASHLQSDPTWTLGDPAPDPLLASHSVLAITHVQPSALSPTLSKSFNPHYSALLQESQDYSLCLLQAPVPHLPTFTPSKSQTWHFKFGRSTPLLSTVVYL